MTGVGRPRMVGTPAPEDGPSAAELRRLARTDELLDRLAGRCPDPVDLTDPLLSALTALVEEVDHDLPVPDVGFLLGRAVARPKDTVGDLAVVRTVTPAARPEGDARAATTTTVPRELVAQVVTARTAQAPADRRGREDFDEALSGSLSRAAAPGRSLPERRGAGRAWGKVMDLTAPRRPVRHLPASRTSSRMLPVVAAAAAAVVVGSFGIAVMQSVLGQGPGSGQPVAAASMTSLQSPEQSPGFQQVRATLQLAVTAARLGREPEARRYLAQAKAQAAALGPVSDTAVLQSAVQATERYVNAVTSGQVAVVPTIVDGHTGTATVTAPAISPTSASTTATVPVTSGATEQPTAATQVTQQTAETAQTTADTVGPDPVTDTPTPSEPPDQTAGTDTAGAAGAAGQS